MDYSPAELIATFVARQIRDGDFVMAGAGLFIPRAGVLLAHFTRCPNVRLCLGDYFVNLHDAPFVEDIELYADQRIARWAEALLPLEVRYDVLPRLDLFFVGALQVDRFGNTNLIGVGREHGRPRVRGAGGIGTSSVTALARRYFIYTTEHTPRVFVERCDYRSTVGWADGGADARQRLGLPGGGPEFVLTPLGVLDFAPGTKALRLRFLAPGATVDDVRANTGFPLAVADEVSPLDPPTAEELSVLRTRVDPQGILRR